MFHALARKGRQLAADPVLRRWLVSRALKRVPGEPTFTPHRPPYLNGATLESEPPRQHWQGLAPGVPSPPLIMRLPGETITVTSADQVVERDFPDLETLLGFHRFAWVPLMTGEPGWVAAIWRAWCRRFGTPDQSWAWHPYTAAERAINLMTFARRHGLPGPVDETLASLAAHAPAIAQRLEWFGDHHTSNHCFNNGRGLYSLGLDLGLPAATTMGERILTEEAARIFRPSGVLREASTHYHLLLTRSLASVWLAARAHGRPEAAMLEQRLRAAFAVLPRFDLPGGFPLVGDVSPDCPPEHLFGLLPGRDPAQGWTGLLPADDCAALTALRDGVTPVASDILCRDGWLRHDCAGWSGLWHAEPAGWSPMPGHGHQDCGAAELHFGAEIIFADPGRGSYAQAGEADFHVASGSHGGLGLDGCDPYPPNRPYYATAFRAAAASGTQLSATADVVRLIHGGYGRLGARRCERSWHFTAAGLTIDDVIQGHGRHTVTRRLITGLAAEIRDGAVMLTAPSRRRFRIAAEDGSRPDLAPITLWRAYGEGVPGKIVSFTNEARLDWRGRLTIEVA
jgi:hypothetical protein